MSTRSQPDKHSSLLTDGDRWDGHVVAEKTGTITWGTHRFEVSVQQFDDGEGHITVRGVPTDPPPCAREIVADWLDAGPLYREVAAILADGWAIDIEEVSD